MRVISQNGEVDFPYERIMVMQNFDNVIAVTDLQETQIVLGRYSSAEKAEKAIEILRGEYLKYMEIEGHADITGAGIIQPNFWVLPKIFQFPKDDEVEV